LHTNTHLGTSKDLADEEVGADIGNLVEERLSLSRPLVEPPLGVFECLRTTALAHVRHERPRRAAETDEGNTPVEALAGHSDGLKDVAELLTDVDRVAEAREVSRAAQGSGEHRALARLHEDLHTKRLRDHENVAEDDRGVKKRVPVDRLESELARELGLLAALEERVVLADLEELCAEC
jgi:hypothetical protein